MKNFLFFGLCTVFHVYSSTDVDTVHIYFYYYVTVHFCGLMQFFLISKIFDIFFVEIFILIDNRKLRKLYRVYIY